MNRTAASSNGRPRGRDVVAATAIVLASALTAPAQAAPQYLGPAGQLDRRDAEPIGTHTTAVAARSTVAQGRTVVHDRHRDSGSPKTDIHRVRFRNGPRQAVARVKLARFQPSYIGVRFAIDVGKRRGRAYNVTAIKKLAADGRHFRKGWDKALYRYQNFPDRKSSHRVRCGLTVTGFPAKDVVRIAVPQSCLGRTTKGASLQVRTCSPFEGWWTHMQLDKVDAGFTRLGRA